MITLYFYTRQNWSKYSEMLIPTESKGWVSCDFCIVCYTFDMFEVFGNWILKWIRGQQGKGEADLLGRLLLCPGKGSWWLGPGEGTVGNGEKWIQMSNTQRQIQHSSLLTGILPSFSLYPQAPTQSSASIGGFFNHPGPQRSLCSDIF